jgi:hypothetical protein
MRASYAPNRKRVFATSENHRNGIPRNPDNLQVDVAGVTLDQEGGNRMMRRDGASARKERIEKIARSIQVALFTETELSLAKTMATLQYETGLTEGKLMEYLKIIEKLGQIIINSESDKIVKPAGV